MIQKQGMTRTRNCKNSQSIGSEKRQRYRLIESKTKRKRHEANTLYNKKPKNCFLSRWIRISKKYYQFEHRCK